MQHNRLYDILAAAAIILSTAYALNEFVFTKSYPVTVAYHPPPAPAPVIEPEIPRKPAPEPEPEPEPE
jgi:hypothetical protein